MGSIPHIGWLGKLFGFSIRDPPMNSTPLPKAVKLNIWLDCLAKWYTFHLSYSTTTKLAVRSCWLPPLPTPYLDPLSLILNWIYSSMYLPSGLLCCVKRRMGCINLSSNDSSQLRFMTQLDDSAPKNQHAI